jgi:AhpD family alkylhydroperoxidase
MSDTPQRLHPIVLGQDPALAAIEAKIVAKRGKITPLYTYLLNSPKVADGWEELTRAVRQSNSLPASIRELVILRVAVLNRALYEFNAHSPLALEAGLNPQQIDAVKETHPNPQFFSALELIVLELTDTMTRDIEVPDELFSRVHLHYQGRQLLDLCITIGTYNMVSRVLVALHIGH